MSVRDLILIAIAGLLLLGYLTVRYEKEPIEQLLSEKAKAAFEEFGVSDSVRVTFDGRDARLVGRVVSLDEKRRVQRVVEEHVWDVRIVDNLLAVDAPSIVERTVLPPAASTSFRLAYAEDGSIDVAAKVPNESALNQILRAVEGAFPETAINNNLEINDEIDLPSWFPSVLALIPTIGLVEQPLVEIEKDSSAIIFSGEVVGEAQRDAVIEDATQAMTIPYELAPDIRVMETQVIDEDPEIAALRTRVETLLRTTRIQFRINTAVLVPLSKKVLDDVMVVLKEAPDLNIEVQGHTDNTGSNALNRELSQARADAVRDYMVSQGMKAENLTAVGFGPTRPVATNTTLEGRISNRRVVFSLKGGS